MRKIFLSGLMLALVAIGAVLSRPARADPAASLSADTTGSDLVDTVNALRAAQGLPGYQVNSILMMLAQQHAEYMASIGVSDTHTDAQGRRPFQRALEAGYPVAGDLSLGGFYSENVIGGIGMTPQQAVTAWLGDEAHKGTMLSTVLRDVGGGVAVVGNTYYYDLDAGLSTGGTPVAFTPFPPLASSTQVVVQNTPNADGSITYIVQQGDTPLAIALAYGISLVSLEQLNNLTNTSVIYPGQKLMVRSPSTPTATFPTFTPTEPPSPTLWPTSTYTDTPPPPTPTSPPSANFPVTAAGGSVIAIALVALIAAGMVAWVSSGKHKQ